MLLYLSQGFGRHSRQLPFPTAMTVRSSIVGMFTSSSAPCYNQDTNIDIYVQDAKIGQNRTNRQKMTENQIVGIKEAARRLGISEHSLRQKCNDGKIPGAFQLGNSGMWRIDFSALCEQGTKKPDFSAQRQELLDKHWNKLADIAGEVAEACDYRAIARKANPLNELYKEIRARHKPSPSIPGIPMLADRVVEIIHPLEPFDRGKGPPCQHRLKVATLNNSLITHLESEYKGFTKKLEDWKQCALLQEKCNISGDVAVHPYKDTDIKAELRRLEREITDILSVVAERRTFMGKCEICKDWQTSFTPKITNKITNQVFSA